MVLWHPFVYSTAGLPNPPLPKGHPPSLEGKGEHGHLGVSMSDGRPRQVLESPLPFRGGARGEVVSRLPTAYYVLEYVVTTDSYTAATAHLAAADPIIA